MTPNWSTARCHGVMDLIKPAAKHNPMQLCSRYLQIIKMQ